MALDIGIGDGTSFSPSRDEPLLQLEDGYYWFLHPIFEDLARATGQYIDQYGDAAFSGDHLRRLEGSLDHALALVASRPETWDVGIGWEQVSHPGESHGRPHLRESIVSVDKSRFLALLSQWQRVVERAKELGRPVVCFGD